MLESLLMQAKGGGSVGPEVPDEIGTFWQGGYYTGKIRIDGKVYALVLAPKATGESIIKLTWKTTITNTNNTMSLSDGWGNTQAMVVAGIDLHPAAKYCRSLVIDGYDDWYLPAVDELEMCYRSFKPTVTNNSTGTSSIPYSANGYNPSSIPIGAAYTATNPAITSSNDFRNTGIEAFATDWYQTSSQESNFYRWMQSFADGAQIYDYKSNSRYVRAVRRVLIE